MSDDYHRIGSAGRRREVAARQDRIADAGERFFGRSAQQNRPAERKAMIDCAHDLPITRQAEVLNISRGINGHRPHSSLDGSTPDQAYFNPLPIRLAA